MSPFELNISQIVVRVNIQCQAMIGIFTFFIPLLSTAIAATDSGRLVRVTKRSSSFPESKKMALALVAERAGRLVRVTKRSSSFPESKEMALALAVQEAGRLIRVTKRSNEFPASKAIPSAGDRYQLNHQEGRKMDRRYQHNGPKEATSNIRYHLQDPEEIDGKYQLKDKNSAFLIHIPSGKNTMTRKLAIRRSCWFQYYTKCPRESSRPRSLPQEKSAGIPDTRITQRAVLQALGF